MTETTRDDGDAVEWTTDQGSDVTVTADNGRLFVTLDGSDETGAGVSFRRQRAELTTKRGTDVLDAGRQRDESGERFNAFVPVDGRREEIEALREESVIEPTDEPLTYEVKERTEQKPTLDGWGGGERTVTSLEATKRRAEMTERQKELHRKVDTDSVPDDAEVGDEIAVDELLEDPRTSEERDQDAIEEAAETGEEVVISRGTTDCNDADKECNLDHVTRVATPDGEIETRRTHTY